ncbi:MAG: stage II sporulation protein M [Anaerolineae bacterium]|nr:stage II sporulation protein M [Thermoflexales bacterium]MDW8407422.1 stage II sporulation protein M [Anaerolineae bacterium]
MKVEQFIELNRANWEMLAALTQRAAGHGIRRMKTEELEQLGELYRSATSDFAVAQRDFAGHPVVSYLNQLIGQAHGAIYRGRPSGAWNIIEFFIVTFPRTFRKLAPFTLTAFLVLMIPAIINGVLIGRDPQALEWTLGEDAKEVIPLLERGKLWIDDFFEEEDRPAISAFIATNNIRVSLLAFAGGASAGLVTLYVLFINGLSLGGLMGLTFYYGLGWRLVNFVIGHGVIELTVIFMTGGAGLRMGWAILRPGQVSRKDALFLATREAFTLAIGAVPLLVIAGLIESFISPLFNPLYSIIAAVLSGALMYGWLLRGGRAEERGRAGKQESGRGREGWLTRFLCL